MCAEIFIVYPLPVAPLLHDLLTIHKHGAEEDTSGQTTAFLTIVASSTIPATLMADCSPVHAPIR